MDNLVEYVKKNKVFLIVLAVILIAGLVGLKLKSKRTNLKLGAKPSASAKGAKAGAPGAKAGGPMVTPTVPLDALRPKDIKGGGKGIEEIGSLDIQNKELILMRIKVGFDYDYLNRFNPYVDWRVRLAQKSGPELKGTRMLSEGQQQDGAAAAGKPYGSAGTGGEQNIDATGQGEGTADMASLAPPADGSTAGQNFETAAEIDLSGTGGTAPGGAKASTVTLLYKGLFGLPRNKIAIIKEKSDVGESVELKTEGERLTISGLTVQTIDSDKIILLNPADGSLQELPLATKPETEETEEEEEQGQEQEKKKSN